MQTERFLDERNRCIGVADSLISTAETVQSLAAKLVLLKEALRLYLMVAYKAVGVEVDNCYSLVEMYMDINDLAEKHDFGFLKLEGFTCLDLHMAELLSVTDADIKWFADTLKSAAEKVKKYLEE